MGRSMRWRWCLAAGVVTLAAACGPVKAAWRRSAPGEPQLIWEEQGNWRAESVSVAAQGLPAVAPGVRRGVWGETPDGTYQLLDASVAEAPHVHAEHDLTIVLLRGRGALIIGTRRHALAAGDVVHVGRGLVHHFHPVPDTSVLGLAIYQPQLKKPDYLVVDPPSRAKSHVD